MSEVVRLYRYRSLLSARRAVSVEELMAELEISKATLKRDLAKLRDQLHVPIEFDRNQGGYILGQESAESELPGLWFSQQEILALVTIQQLLEQLEPGLLGAKLRPLQNRLAQLMTKHGLSEQDISKRIRIVHAGKRTVVTKWFEAVAAATMERHRLKIAHFNRQDGKSVERVISPQRLVHYRDNWYVDAWCHLRNDLRSFSIDAITKVDVLKQKAKEMTATRIDNVVNGGYGIFSGPPKAWAVLKFTSERARWVSGEVWHPQQRAATESDGSYVLSIPYSDERELVGDIMRFGADIQVLGPPELRAKVRQKLLQAVEMTRYAPSSGR